MKPFLQKTVGALIFFTAFSTSAVFAAEPSVTQLIDELTPKQRGKQLVKQHSTKSRGIVLHPDQASEASNSNKDDKTAGASAPSDSASAPSVSLQILFQSGSAKLMPESESLLNKLSKAVNAPALSSYRFKIAGHTDAAGSAEYNQKLSERRAAAVREYLVSNGIESSRLSSTGFGESQLKDPNAPLDNVNRRVEIINVGSGNN